MRYAATILALTLVGSQRITNGLKHAYLAPPLKGIAGWLNSEPLTLSALRGKVVLVDFWTYSCINCLRTLPHVESWDQKYRKDGLVVIGVHSPEFKFEKDSKNIAAAIQKYQIQYPVANDNALATWASFNNNEWPAEYLIDQQGRVVYVSFGEGDYDVTENNIRSLLGLAGQVDPDHAQIPYTDQDTPETYLGSARAERKDPGWDKSIGRDHWDLNSQWTVDAQKIVSTSAGASLRLHFYSKKVFLVLGKSSDQPVHLKISLNGQDPGSQAGIDAPGGVVTIDGHRLYELINQDTTTGGTVQIAADAPSAELYSFTFGR